MKALRSLPLLFLLCLTTTTSINLEAAYVITDNGFQNIEEAATMSAASHYAAGMGAMDRCDWKEASKQFIIVIKNFPDEPIIPDCYYNLGIAYFQLKEPEFANIEFSNYLKCQNNPQMFEEAVAYKYAIAEAFRCGARRRLFKSKSFPKWMTGRSVAVQIYDEVIAALPCHELAAQALYSKAYLLLQTKNYRDSIDAYQVLIRRFPKHELAPDSYIMITRVYLEQSKTEFQNPDILALAELNVRRFKQDFPRDDRLQMAEDSVREIQEIYASGLYETGQFYERTQHPNASIIYYKTAIDRFPNTVVAEWSKCRLEELECLE